jgi:hypothetical protein
MFRKFNLVRYLLLFAVLLASALSVYAQEPQAISKWESFDFAHKSLMESQLSKTPLDELRLMRGIVFGRHGRVFKEVDIKSYLEGRPWYKPAPNFENSSLNQTERSNLDLIRGAEAREHPTIEPGDLRWWQARAFSAEQLGEHTAAEWNIMRAEIEAIHGKSFDDQPWLQKYFEDRYWYKADPGYNPRGLSKIEWGNIATIEREHRRQRNVAISPGDAEHFQNAPISESMLRGLNLYELRLLRNEFYARHGRIFKTAWLSDYFQNQPYFDYEPRESFKDTELSDIEKKNVDTIVAYENRLKEELSTKPISKSMLDGLFLEDARKLRNEIYARHGKIFKDRWLNKYFSGFDWYKPNQSYTDASLTPTERKNVATILSYETEATSAANAIEA